MSRGTFIGEILTISPCGIFPRPGPLIESCGSLVLSKASILASMRSPTMNLVREVVGRGGEVPPEDELPGKVSDEARVDVRLPSVTGHVDDLPDDLVLDPRDVGAGERDDLDVVPDYLGEPDAQRDHVVAPSLHEHAWSIVASDYDVAGNYLFSCYFHQFSISPM